MATAATHSVSPGLELRVLRVLPVDDSCVFFFLILCLVFAEVSLRLGLWIVAEGLGLLVTGRRAQDFFLPSFHWLREAIMVIFTGSGSG